MLSMQSFRSKNTTLEIKSNAISDLKGIIDKYNILLNGNKSCGENGSYVINGKKTECKIPNPVKYEIFPKYHIKNSHIP